MEKNMFFDYIANIGLEAVKDRIVEEKDKLIVKNRIKDYLDRQTKLNEFVQKDEELDFCGLAEYIRTKLIEDVQMRLFGTPRERGAARTTIIAKAIEYSQANTHLSRKRAIKLTETAIDILKDFYTSKTNRELKFIAARIEDTITEVSEQQHLKQNEQLIGTISEQTESILASISEHSSMAVDVGMQMMRDGRFSQVEAQINNYFDALACTHTLSPYYGFQFDSVKRRLYSAPLIQEAKIKYPEKICCTGTVQINGKYIDKFDYNTIDFANRHQLPITLNIATAKKLLGDVVDPIQHEAEDLIGESIILPPKPFPPAFPCSISIDDEVYFDYILLRTQEVLDDGTIVLSNQEQSDSSFSIKLIADLTLKKATYSFRVNGNNHKDLLKYLLFLQKAISGSILSIKVLSLGEELTQGKLDNIDYTFGLETINEDISFIEKVIAIEDYFNTTLSLPHEISNDDFNLISYFADIILGNECYGNWTKFEFVIPLTDKFRNIVSDSDNTPFSLSYVGSFSATIYGQTFELPAIRTFNSVKYLNLERLKQKVSVLDIGDDIKVSFVPGDGESGTWTDVLHSETRDPHA